MYILLYDFMYIYRFRLFLIVWFLLDYKFFEVKKFVRLGFGVLV